MARRDDDDDQPRRGGGFRYQARDAETIRKRAERSLSTTDPYLKDVCKIYKAPEGDNNLRILPPTWENAEHYGTEVFIHYDVGADGGSYLCLEKMKGKPCPVCEERNKAKADGDNEYADKLRPNQRVLIYVLDRDKEKDGVQVWGIGARMDQDIGRLAIDKRTQETLAIDHPTKGYDFSFDRKGEGMKTRYSAYAFSRRPSAVDNDKALDFIAEHPLPEQLIYYSYDHIAKVFSGKTSKATREDDDDDKPKRRASRDDDDDKPVQRKARAPEVDMTWDEVHALSFRKLSNLIEEHGLKLNPDDSRDDEELAGNICEELGIKKAKAKARDDDDEPAPRRRTAVDDDDDKPTRNKLRSMRDEG